MSNQCKVNQELSDWIITQRRYLHQYPELSHQEKHTREYLKSRLEELALVPTSYTGKDVVADLHGDYPGPVFAIRADIDALEINEETNLPFASKNVGYMHACGHDGHMAIVLGVAKLLSTKRTQIHGTVRFIFQHAEETVPGGAEELVKSGVLDDVSAIVGCHLWEQLEKGYVGFKEGPLMAGADRFEVTIQGKGGHGSMPHLAVDPVLVSTHAIQQLYSIVSRQLNPLHPAVLSIGELKMGSSYNVIPDKAFFTGTVRYFDPIIQQSIRESIQTMLDGVCTSFHASYDWKYEVGEPPLVNDPSLTSFVEKEANKIVSLEQIVQAEPSLGGEDFAHYTNEVPATYFFLGIGEKGHSFGHHHPKFDIDESMMIVGTEILSQAALTYLSAKE
ncbi:M20 metallopeptidase family protein [Salipaludibacillus daqingensis]|uniref:M20 metallopeptidase family protein n=1 Tax=Salipaludibacillus daqingensis TaxID=3041001 RepID=UPI002474CFAE|nr:amidohydrolase [Salipaludibacillus daqingensis]